MLLIGSKLPVLNLIVNARDALPDGGNVYISLKRSAVMNKLAGGSVESTAGAFAKLAVRDDGVGIAVDVKDKIFEPFFTTKSTGLGIGLSINRTIIESFGGRMWAENVPGGGAVISFSLPVHTGDDP